MASSEVQTPNPQAGCTKRKWGCWLCLVLVGLPKLEVQTDNVHLCGRRPAQPGDVAQFLGHCLRLVHACLHLRRLGHPYLHTGARKQGSRVGRVLPQEQLVRGACLGVVWAGWEDVVDVG